MLYAICAINAINIYIYIYTHTHAEGDGQPAEDAPVLRRCIGRAPAAREQDPGRHIYIYIYMCIQIDK